MVTDFFLIKTAEAAGSITNAPTFLKIFTNVLTFLLSIAGLVAIIAVVISGLLYLSSAGNPKMITLAKSALIFSVIGIIIVLGALVFVSQITRFFP